MKTKKELRAQQYRLARAIEAHLNALESWSAHFSVDRLSDTRLLIEMDEVCYVVSVALAPIHKL